MSAITTSTKLMLHAQSLADVCGHTQIAFGGASVSTLQSKFGSSSFKFTQSTGDHITSSNSSDFDFGAGDFTIDFWAYEQSAALPLTSIAREKTATYPPFIINYNGTVWMSSNGVAWDIAAGKTFGARVFDTWQHLEISRQGNTFRTFRNGVMQDTWTSTLAFPTNSNPLAIGTCQNGGSYFNGYMDEIRIDKGVCRHSANFTPETAEYTALTLIAPAISGNIVASVAVNSDVAHVDLIDTSATPSGRYQLEWAHVVSDVETNTPPTLGAALTAFVSVDGGATFLTGPNYHNAGQSIFTGETNPAYLLARVSGGQPQGISTLGLQRLDLGMRLSIDAGDFKEYGSTGTADVFNRGGHTIYTSVGYKGAGGGNAGGSWFPANAPQYFHWPIPIMYVGHFDGALGQQPNAFRLTMGGSGLSAPKIRSGVFILRRLN